MRCYKTAIAALVIAAIAVSPACIREKASNRIDDPGSYLAQTPPGQSPEMFARDKVSTEFDQRDACFNPDGQQFFYTLSGPQRPVILCIELEDERWTRPFVPTFSGRYADLEPAFSPDGSKLFFASKRPIQGRQPKDWDIWYTTPTDSGWARPVNVGPPINTDGNEYYPSLTNSGAIYFTAERPDGLGKEDIYRSKLVDGRWTAPENLGSRVNSEHWEFNAFVAPDESYLIYTSAGRPDGLGGGDLYISFADSSGSFGPSINMGPTVNSPALDYCPYVSPDGAYLFFTSQRLTPSPEDTARVSYEDIQHLMHSPDNGSSNLYWMSAAIIDSLRPR